LTGQIAEQFNEADNDQDFTRIRELENPLLFALQNSNKIDLSRQLSVALEICNFLITGIWSAVLTGEAVGNSARSARLSKIGAIHRAVGLHVPSLKLTADGNQRYRFATINVCRSAIVQAALSGGSSRESLRSLFLRITGSTATTELPL
jgi:hypothetical protein